MQERNSNVKYEDYELEHRMNSSLDLDYVYGTVYNG